MEEKSRLLRICGAIVAAGVVWHVALAGSMGLLRLLWPEYDAAYPDRAYTLPMLWVRLLVFSSVIVATGATATLVARDPRLAWFAGVVILGLSIPPHFYPGHVWAEYPPWYHYTYLASILPMAIASGRIGSRSS